MPPPGEWLAIQFVHWGQKTMLNDYPLCLFKCVTSYLNVIIQFRGSLLISKCFTSQETFFLFSPYILAVSKTLTDFSCYNWLIRARQCNKNIHCTLSPGLNRNLYLVPDTSTIQSQQLITMANTLICCAFKMVEDVNKFKHLKYIPWFYNRLQGKPEKYESCTTQVNNLSPGWGFDNLLEERSGGQWPLWRRPWTRYHFHDNNWWW